MGQAGSASPEQGGQHKRQEASPASTSVPAAALGLRGASGVSGLARELQEWGW